MAHDGRLTPWQEGDWLALPRHQFWARPAPSDRWTLEILLEERRDDLWLYRRDPAVTMPLARLGRTSSDGVPFLCPEVALLYKARRPWMMLERNAQDFETAAPLLEPAAREWLCAALDRTDPDHPWLTRLRQS